MSTTHIPMEQIRCIPDREISEADIAARAKSIKENGLIQPIAIQPIEDRNYKFQVVAGKCRFRAFQLLEYKSLEIGEHVRFVNGDPKLLAFAENNERTELSLADQVRQLGELSEQFGIKELAAQTGYSEKFIALRIRLNNLSKSWTKALDEGSLPKSFGPAHLDALAKYSPEAQEDIWRQSNHYMDSFRTLKDWSDHLNKNQMNLLSTASWDTTKALSKKLKACSECLERSGAQEWLFDDLKDPKQDRCLNHTCFQKHQELYTTNEAKKCLKKKDGPVLVANGFMQCDHPLHGHYSKVLRSYEWDIAKPNTKNAKPALIVCGRDAGKYVHVVVRQRSTSNASTGTTKSKTLKERRALHKKKRLRHAAKEFMQTLRPEAASERIYSRPSNDTMLRLAMCMGVSSPLGYSWRKDDEEDYGIKNTGHDLGAWKGICDSEADAVEDLFWEQLLDNILSHINGQTQMGTIDTVRHECCETIAGILEITDAWKTHIQEATQALPEPKSWKKLAETEKNPAKDETPTKKGKKK